MDPRLQRPSDVREHVRLMAAERTDWALSWHVQSALQLLSISGGLLAQLGSFEATLRNTLIELGNRLATVHRVLESG